MEEQREKIGPYTLVKEIGKGGMGEVWLAFDPTCERNVALKRIRPDLKNKQSFKDRFLKEAKITAGLTHPGIITIYSIVEEDREIYYTMPYVEGNTFKEILRRDDNLPIPQLLPIFKSICQTVSYIHSKGIIHRDLKPENILVGKFGEVIILDWGLAQSINEREEESADVKQSHPDLTHPGKIVGTLAYMAPERALANPATMQTDIYALGIILYQLLTLHLPFDRGTIKEYRKNYIHEKLILPEEMAPYRDVPLGLSSIAQKAVAASPHDRYQTMNEMTADLLNYMEGKSQWFKKSILNVKRKRDWEFQENVLITKHIAITRAADLSEWVSLMISKESFAENTRLETKIYIKKEGLGLGILLSVPEAAERENPLDGYCLWLGTEGDPSSRLFRNTVEVMRLPELFLKKEKWHHLVIEKIDDHIHFTLDRMHKFKYLSHLPLAGTHVGLLSMDDAFAIDEITVSVGSHPLQVSCLSIPDAFLASKDFKRALAEYRRIADAFSGHAEGREALFRAGVTLVEQAKNEKSVKKSEKAFSTALEEFEKLRKTPGAPLEYLGKALVYEALHDNLEEINCLELAFRRYPEHPLLHVIEEQIIYRTHETAASDRRSAYRLILIALRQLPKIARREDSLRLFRGLIANAEALPFEENPLDPSTYGKEEEPREQKLNEFHFAAVLSFWLASPYLLHEIYEDVLTIASKEDSLIGNILYFLFEIGSHQLATRLIGKDELLQSLSLCHEKGVKAAYQYLLSLKKEDIGVKEFRIWIALIQFALFHGEEKLVEEMASHLTPLTLAREDRILLDAYRIWAYLLQNKIKEAGALFDDYSPELLNQETTLLHPLFGCYLLATEGEEIALIHFAGVIDTPFPRSWALLGHELTNHLTQNPAWLDTSFLWERRMLYRQLTLYYIVSGNKELASFYKHLEQEEYIQAD